MHKEVKIRLNCLFIRVWLIDYISLKTLIEAMTKTKPMESLVAMRVHGALLLPSLPLFSVSRFLLKLPSDGRERRALDVPQPFP